MRAEHGSRTVAVCKLLIAVSVAAMLTATVMPGVRIEPVVPAAAAARPASAAIGEPSAAGKGDTSASAVPPETTVVPDGGAYFSIDDEADIAPSVMREFNPPPASAEERFATHLARLTSLYEGDPEEDIEAIWALAFDLGRQADAIQALAPMQGHPVERVRELVDQAITALTASLADDASLVAGIGAEPYLPESDAHFRSLYDVAISGTDAFERREALGELGTVPKPESVFALEDVLYQAGDPDLQKEALEALANIASMQVEAEHIQSVFDNVVITAVEDIAGLANDGLDSLADPGAD